MVMIKRERYRGKYYVVHREGKKVIERRKWSSRPKPFEKSISTSKAKTNFKANKSIYDDRKRSTGSEWKFVEETRTAPSNIFILTGKDDKGRKVKPPTIRKRRNVKYQYVIEGVILRKTGAHVKVVAASKQHDPDYPRRKAREEAIQSFYERAHGIYRGNSEVYYDANEGKKLLEDGKVEVRHEHIKHYVKK